MKLYTFFKQDDKVVYGTTVNGKCFFFFSGFASAEEAKDACVELHASFQTGCSRAFAKLLVAPMFESAEWSEIE
jgi:septal ring-binding cell division protein DamX